MGEVNNMTEFTFRIKDVVINHTDNWRRPMDIRISGVLTIYHESRNCFWGDALKIIDKRFPDVEFNIGWEGQTCRFSPIENPVHYVEDPECELFVVEV
jgi:hypothetical protein